MVRLLPDHSVRVIAASTAAFILFVAAYFGGMRSSDGANYAGVARNFSEGRGLTSSTIQPGLVGVVPTSRDGQAFVIQAPLWPVVLAGAFRIFGSNETVFLWVNGVLFVVVLAQAWRLGYLLTGNTGGAWLAWALATFNPFLIGSAIAGTATMLQAALLSAIFLTAMSCTLSFAGVLPVGLLLGLACVTRENSIFMTAAVMSVWFARLRETSAPERRPVGRLAALVTVMLGVAAIPVVIEAFRKASIIGHFDAPVLRLSFLYYTKVADQGWYFIHDHPMLKIDPMAYFTAHPGELLAKMWFQVWVSFGRETVPTLLCFVPWFVPIVVPSQLRSGLPRAACLGLLVTLCLQVIIGSTSFLNVTYFFAFVPAIGACVAATVFGLANALRSRTTLGLKGAIGGGLLCYGVAPLLVNVMWLVSGTRPGTGDYELSLADERALSGFILANTRAGTVLSASHAALLAWDTRRTIFQYSAEDRYTVQDNPMWRSLDEAVPIDYILLNSLVRETPDRHLLPGFKRAARLERGKLHAWLFARDSEEGTDFRVSRSP